MQLSEAFYDIEAQPVMPCTYIDFKLDKESH